MYSTKTFIKKFWFHLRNIIAKLLGFIENEHFEIANRNYNP